METELSVLILAFSPLPTALLLLAIEQALASQKEADDYKSRMEKAYRERDLYTPAIKEAVTASRNLLKALNQKNPKRLSEWGFEVDDSAQTPKKPKNE